MFLTQERAKAKLSAAARLSAYAVAAAVVVALPAQGRADVWDWLTGLVRTQPEPAALTADQLPPDAIVSGRGEKRILRLGRDILELHPSTAVTIDEAGPHTSVRLITGTVRAKVAKRTKEQSFEVHTLTLLATVKGTEFEVSATPNGSAVSVYEGEVAVKGIGSGGGVDVTPGKTATVAGAEDSPRLGPTPSGGAAAAAKALESAAMAAPASDDDPGDDEGSAPRDIKVPGRAVSGGNAGQGSNGNDGDRDDGDGEGGDDGGEGGDDGGDDDDGEGGDDGGEGGDDGGDDD